MYVIRNSAGLYFVTYQNFQPVFATNSAMAAHYDHRDANKIASDLTRIGCEAKVHWHEIDTYNRNQRLL